MHKKNVSAACLAPRIDGFNFSCRQKENATIEKPPFAKMNPYR